MAGVLLHIARELARQAALNARVLAVHTAFWFALHVLFGHVLTTLVPHVYDVFNRGAIAAGKKPLSRTALRKEVRTRIVATLFALYVVGACLLGAFVWGDYAEVQRQGHFGSTPLTVHLNRVAVGFFVWDLYVSVVDGYGPAFVFHGVACLAVFVGALEPRMHFMAFVALGFEASTPFLHARRLLIMAGATQGALFLAAQYGFAASFFVARIAVGYTTCASWAAGCLRELAAPTMSPPMDVPMAYMYLTLCAGLSALNGWWFFEIARIALGGGKAAKAQRAEPSVGKRE